jgi:hypothetical protein
MDDEYGRTQKVVQKTTITSSTSETVIVTALANYYQDLYGLILANTSGTVCSVSIRSKVNGTVRLVFSVPAGETRGFMLPPAGGHNQPNHSESWTATCSASVASIEITAFALKNSI